MRQNHLEYIRGFYETGRHAWILTDIVPLQAPIQVKGKLRIWDYMPSKK
ncbi:MAG: hypothetical protein HFG15_04875 [Bacilli bacterium]|jgi:hypothetical protein|nr:hypothetical protein [Bacilli bacterium]